MIPTLPEPDALTALLAPTPRVLFVGASGRGKSTALRAVAQRRGAGCAVICADPGQPAFGPPGALALGRWSGGAVDAGGAWLVDAVAGLGSLDAVRFRLPLAVAAARLSARLDARADARRGGAPLLVDAPGVYRGAVAAELVAALAAHCRVDAVVLIAREGEAEHLAAALRGPWRLLRFRPVADARDTSTAERARRRSALWAASLVGVEPRVVRLADVDLIGTPPPLSDPEQWPGRQVALLDAAGGTLAMGEVRRLSDGVVEVLAPDCPAPTALLIRDARWVEGALRTHGPLPPPVKPTPPRRGEPIPLHLGTGATLAGATARFLGGLFDDPALHIRLNRRGESLLFDVGEGPRLTRRLCHQLRAIFVSHAHQDHFGGFTRVVRGRTDRPEPCLVFGPPGLAQRVAGFVDGFTWDRIGDGGCVFRVGELHGERLAWFTVRAGAGRPAPDGHTEAPGGLLLEDPLYTVRAVTLDHAGLPVLAFAFEWTRTITMHAERLVERGLRAGPWVAELRRRFVAGDGGVIALPDVGEQPLAEAAAELLVVRDGPRLVYATDLGDTPANRAAMAAFASGADVLVCEASFRAADEARARHTGHLTGRACGAIAEAAGVKALAPFHLSARYEDDPAAALAEVCRATTAPVTLPPSLDAAVRALL